MMHKKNYFTLTLLLSSLAIGVASAQSAPQLNIGSSIKGKASGRDRKSIETLFGAFAHFARSPERLTLQNVVAATGTKFKDPVCFKQDSGPSSCSHDNVDWDVKTFAISVLRTVSQERESDRGAVMVMQIARGFACIPTRAVDKFWGVQPIKGANLMPDSFAGDKKPMETINTTFYKGISPNADYVHVETRSKAGCVIEMTLSTLRSIK